MAESYRSPDTRWVRLEDLRRIAQGREAEIFEWEKGSVLRLFREPGMRERAERESRALRAVRTALPLVPELRGELSLGGREKIRRRLADSKAVPAELARRALATLERLPDAGRLCHGDFWPANVLLAARGPVVIDWADASRGDSTGDLARTTLMTRAGSLPPGTPWLVARFGRLGAGIFEALYRRA